MIKELKNKGISLKAIHTCLVAITVILSGLLVYSTYHLTVTFRHVTNAAEEHMEMEKASLEMLDASDYLTEQVQRFTINGEKRFMDEYFREAFEANRREEALSKMGEDPASAAAMEELQKAMNESVKLMDAEYYAIRLTAEAKNITELPDVIAAVALSEEDQKLSAREKMERAAKSVMSDDYYNQKDLIRGHIRQSIAEIDKLTKDIDNRELDSLYTELRIVRGIILVLILAILFMVWLTDYLGINPVLQAVDRIKDDSPIPEVGANEFRYLAKAYNRMYSAYKTSLERLNFKASHDELTGAYNRAGYDLLLSSIDLYTTYMMLFDVDNFKTINDTYGHETGDKVLVRLVSVLKKNFRSDDYICRVGGDEFVVFMVHANEKQDRLIASKMEDINRELEQKVDGLPPISISVGIVHGSQVSDPSKLFEKTDEAMYNSKKQGKNTYTFYPG